MKNLSIILLIVFALNGCVTRQDHEANLNSWMGSEETFLIDQWGPPTNYYETGDKKYLTWKSSNQVFSGGSPPSMLGDGFGNMFYSPGVSPSLITLTCDITMVVQAGIVNSWRYEGNNCYDF